MNFLRDQPPTTKVYVSLGIFGGLILLALISGFMMDPGAMNVKGLLILLVFMTLLTALAIYYLNQLFKNPTEDDTRESDTTFISKLMLGMDVLFGVPMIGFTIYGMIDETMRQRRFNAARPATGGGRRRRTSK